MALLNWVHKFYYGMKKITNSFLFTGQYSLNSLDLKTFDQENHLILLIIKIRSYINFIS